MARAKRDWPRRPIRPRKATLALRSIHNKTIDRKPPASSTPTEAFARVLTAADCSDGCTPRDWLERSRGQPLRRDPAPCAARPSGAVPLGSTQFVATVPVLRHQPVKFLVNFHKPLGHPDNFPRSARSATLSWDAASPAMFHTENRQGIDAPRFSAGPASEPPGQRSWPGRSTRKSRTSSATPPRYGPPDPEQDRDRD